MSATLWSDRPLKRPPIAALVAVAATIALSSCTTSPLGRSRIMLFPSSELDNMGATTFTELRKNTPETRDRLLEGYVQCIVNAIAVALPKGSPSKWQIAVFNQDEANAFALPGGYIGVYTGLLKVASTPDQVAAVLGHEIAHVLAQHANERISTTALTQTGLQLAQVAAGSAGRGDQKELFAVLGLGAQVGILLPFSRTQEREADLLGLDFMATAGFAPHQAVELWRNMGRTDASRPPEFLSTHPTSATRIRDLSARMPRATTLYHQALAAGRRPHCVGRPL